MMILLQLATRFLLLDKAGVGLCWMMWCSNFVAEIEEREAKTLGSHSRENKRRYLVGFVFSDFLLDFASSNLFLIEKKAFKFICIHLPFCKDGGPSIGGRKKQKKPRQEWWMNGSLSFVVVVGGVVDVYLSRVDAAGVHLAAAHSVWVCCGFNMHAWEVGQDHVAM